MEERLINFRPDYVPWHIERLRFVRQWFRKVVIELVRSLSDLPLFLLWKYLADA